MWKLRHIYQAMHGYLQQKVRVTSAIVLILFFFFFFYPYILLSNMFFFQKIFKWNP